MEDEDRINDQSLYCMQRYKTSLFHDNNQEFNTTELALVEHMGLFHQIIITCSNLKKNREQKCNANPECGT